MPRTHALKRAGEIFLHRRHGGARLFSGRPPQVKEIPSKFINNVRPGRVGVDAGAIVRLVARRRGGGMARRHGIAVEADENDGTHHVARCRSKTTSEEEGFTASSTSSRSVRRCCCWC